MDDLTKVAVTLALGFAGFILFILFFAFVAFLVSI